MRFLRNLFRRRPEPPLKEAPIWIDLLCVCGEDQCWCPNTVTVALTYPAPEVACYECRAGRHVWYAV